MRRFSITKDRWNCSVWPVSGLSLIVILAFQIWNLPWTARATEKEQEIHWKSLYADEAPPVPEPRREFRGVWVATVYNLDWPSKPGLPVHQQKAELLEILDRAASLNLNAVVLQVRTMCDAFYDSPLEPWSYYLTGKVGEAPDPYWDPLEYAIDAAHRRGLELHAWFNPFRATTAEYGGSLPSKHVAEQYPWVTRESGRHLWLDPSSEFVRNRFLTVVFDVLNRYDVDAIHIDDYFYPYPEKGKEPGLDDEDNWWRYRYGDALFEEGKRLDRNEWRRELVNGLVEDLYAEIKRTKPWVKLGVSPFGIWRPGYPEKIVGMDAYAQIYADSRRWLQEGWVDYFSPQLYWKSKGPQSFESLYRWWQDQNIHGRHIWPGIAASRLGTGKEGQRWDLMEVVGQLETTRAYLGKSTGSGQLYWHWEAFATNRENISKLITNKRYVDRAISPPSPWLLTEETDLALPLAASIRLEREKKPPSESEEEANTTWRLRWDSEQGNDGATRWWVVQVGVKADPKKEKEDSDEQSVEEWQWLTKWVVPGDQQWARVESLEEADLVAIRAVDKIGRLGEPRLIELTRDK